MKSAEVQSLSVKRAEVEFHKFASLGEPERVLQTYSEENHRRAGLLTKHREFIGCMSPFLEIGANAGHTSYLLANSYGASGFALDLSADALRYGAVLMDAWKLERSPIRMAGDALSLPFRDGSLRFVTAFQMLSQFLDIERVILEVKRVLTPGGVFFFSEEPLRRLLTLRLWRCPYYDTMKPWERKLHDWGLLGFLVRDVIGAAQEESFGIRQNHSMNLQHWHRLVRKHFAECRLEIFVPERGWAESAVKRMAMRLDPNRSVWRAARLLGGTFAAVCRVGGQPPPAEEGWEDRFETLLRCPDCHSGLSRTAGDALVCACGYSSGLEGGVYNLLPSRERQELYPGDREDIIDVSLPGHESRLAEGWHEVEGVFGNRYRWIGPRACARLTRVSNGPQKLRIRGHASAGSFQVGSSVRLEVRANGLRVGEWSLSRTGLFVLEADMPDAGEYRIEVLASPVWQSPPDTRPLTVNLSLLRLLDR